MDLLRGLQWRLTWPRPLVAPLLANMSCGSFLVVGGNRLVCSRSCGVHALVWLYQIGCVSRGISMPRMLPESGRGSEPLVGVM